MPLLRERCYGQRQYKGVRAQGCDLTPSFTCLATEGPWEDDRGGRWSQRSQQGLVMKSFVSHEKDLDFLMNEVSADFEQKNIIILIYFIMIILDCIERTAIWGHGERQATYYLSSRERMPGTSVVAVEMGRSDQIFSIF